MTTIAYRDGVLAADTLINWGGDVLGYTPKIGRAGRLLYGAAGSTAWCWSFRGWLKKGALGDCPPVAKDSGGCVIMPDDDIISFHAEGMERRTKLPFYAWGSGADHAIGAMQMGAGPEEAVRAAMAWDRKTGGEVTILRR